MYIRFIFKFSLFHCVMKYKFSNLTSFNVKIQYKYQNKERMVESNKDYHEICQTTR